MDAANTVCLSLAIAFAFALIVLVVGLALKFFAGPKPGTAAPPRASEPKKKTGRR